jgi:hypothetical protein
MIRMCRVMVGYLLADNFGRARRRDLDADQLIGPRRIGRNQHNGAMTPSAGISEFFAFIGTTPAALAEAIGRLAQADAVALPFLNEATANALLMEVPALPYRKARPVVGEGERTVYQDFDICMDIPAGSALSAFMEVTSVRLGEALALFDPPVLDRAFVLNDLAVQRYAAGSAGISPHRDHVRYVGLVALVPLLGSGCFYVCADRAGARTRDVPAGSGDLILMRAPGLFGRYDRPFHGLREVGAERYSIGLRCDATKLSAPP